MPSALDRQIDGVRRFNRVYTKRMGLLTDHFLRTPYTLAETRVLWELAQRPVTTPGDLAAELGLDPGYLSRILRRFEDQGMVVRTPSADDGRRVEVALTDAGRAAFEPVNERQRDVVAELLHALPAERQEHVAAAMAEIVRALEPAGDAPIQLRDPRPGDLGWVVERHAVLYGAEYGLGGTFEAEVAEIVADFARHFQPGRDRGWIAERDGLRCGSVFVVHETDTTARLRLLLLEPAARGAGLGRRLVRECIAFARAAGYRTLVLWTHHILTAARAIYRDEGFTLVASDTNSRWGPVLTSETWELTL